MIFAYDYKHMRFVQHVDVLSENGARVDGRKSWSLLVAHDSREQKSYRLI